MRRFLCTAAERFNRGIARRGHDLPQYECFHAGDHKKPETLPPLPKGKFVREFLDDWVEYFAPVDEQWPAAIPPCLPPNLEAFKEELVRPGKGFLLSRFICGYDVVAEVHRLQMMVALEMWFNSCPDPKAECRKLSQETLWKYRT